MGQIVRFQCKTADNLLPLLQYAKEGADRQDPEVADYLASLEVQVEYKAGPRKGEFRYEGKKLLEALKSGEEATVRVEAVDANGDTVSTWNRPSFAVIGMIDAQSFATVQETAVNETKRGDALNMTVRTWLNGGKAVAPRSGGKVSV